MQVEDLSIHLSIYTSISPSICPFVISLFVLLFASFRDFSFDIQTALFGYIKILLTSWSVENYPERLKEVLKKLTDQHSAMTLLVHILVNKVSCIFYL